MSMTFSIPAFKPLISFESCHYREVDSEWSYQLHHHDGCELLYAHRGKAIEWIHGASIEMKAGDWLFINTRIRHSTIRIPNDSFAYFCLHLHIEDAHLRNELKTINYFHLKGPVPILETRFERLEQLAQTGFRYQLAVQAQLLSLLDEVLQDVDDAGDRVDINRKELDAQEIDLAIAIERKLAGFMERPVTVEQIAKELYISRSHCNEVFKKVFGLAPRQYLSMLKCKKAEELILHSGLSMETIGERLGFSCTGSFSRQFRRWTSRTPSQYKTMNTIH